MRFFWRIVVLLLVSVFSGAEGKTLAATTEDAKHRAEQRRQQQLPPDQPVDFFSLRKKSDELATRQHPDFKVHQIEVEFDSQHAANQPSQLPLLPSDACRRCDFEMGEVAGKRQHWGQSHYGTDSPQLLFGDNWSEQTSIQRSTANGSTSEHR